MITAEQEKQVTDYLIFQKLPLDVLFEVKDHMIAQVLDIQMNENINFDEAFRKTVELWKDEFKMTSYYAFYVEKIPVIVKKIVKERYNRILKKSFLLGLVSFGINLILIYSANSSEMYASLFKAQNCMFLFALLFVLSTNYKMRQYLKKDFKFKGKSFYTMYQQNMSLLIVCITSLIQIVSRDAEYAFSLFRMGDFAHISSSLFTLIFPFLVQVMTIFYLINFFEHKKTIIRLKNNLKTAG
ncbi:MULTISPECIES: hypothetical protein [unclassified Chryseobacterium]|uniref:hypothetical protein n=1 Tax=unclassified Chryseobacterium TaxID=2593645 RepID=UPI00226A4E22|nr:MULTISPECIES: hypothetical protein [unclassified Chryseobacterium]